LPESTNSSVADHLWAVVLAGGVGSRFWPVSTPARPKQILPLASERPLIADTVARIQPLVPVDRLRILAGQEYVDPIRAAVDGLEQDHFLVEPRARGTAPVLVWAAHHIAAADPDAIMVSLHADHVIRPEGAFRDLVASAAVAAIRHDRLFTIGVRPTRPETGYGYIRRGAALDDTGAHAVDAFVEKPGTDLARQYVEAGDYLWNSGIFVWRADRLLDEVRAVSPELGGLLPLLDAGDPAEYFAVAPRLSIDEGVFERSGRVGVMAATFEWDDVGTWDAVGRTRPADAGGNVVEGDAALVESDRCVVWNEGTEPIVVFGVTDLAIVRAGGVTLVLPRERAADLKTLLDALPPGIREVET
jgi:mannose-1-phosphate guanylyltransferase